MLDTVLSIVFNTWGVVFSGVFGLIAGLVLGDVLRIERHKNITWTSAVQAIQSPSPSKSDSVRIGKSLLCSLASGAVSWLIGLYLFSVSSALLASAVSSMWILLLLLFYYDPN